MIRLVGLLSRPFLFPPIGVSTYTASAARGSRPHPSTRRTTTPTYLTPAARSFIALGALALAAAGTTGGERALLGRRRAASH
ncbi:MAG TPA: hypothetical protein VMN37_04040 [Gemmatimonadales bacterium]|nr:hypothetical protein [Gemmatimonadales bacterium]